tara:strand:- start:173 stop:1870 length:1698 start_codon:yes stop_codon:yes gene_type:complete
MKKLFFILLIPFTLLSQEGYLTHSYIDADANGFVVGQEITVKFEGLNGSGMTPDRVHFDFEWNNKLLEYVSHEFNPTSELPSDAQTTFNQWTGYRFNPIDFYAGVAVSEKNLDEQYKGGWLEAGNSSYPTTADWSVGRVIIQSASDLPLESSWIYVKFRIKDRQGTGYSDYNNVTDLNFANFEDISGGVGLYDIQAGTENISLANVTGVNAGNVTINLQSAAKTDYATDFTYAIYAADGINGKTGEAIESGNFDANGQVITSNLIVDEKYYVEIKLSDQATWLDDILTITDAYIIFKQGNATGAGGPGDTTNQNTFDYAIQYLLGELDNTGNITPADAYQALGHVQGVEGLSEWFTNSINGAKNVWGRVEQLGVSTDDYYFGQKYIIEPTDDTKSFDFGHALIGDVDFSHGYTPTAAGSSYSKESTSQAKSMNFAMIVLEEAIESNLDVVSELIDGKVHFTIDLQEEGIIGTQFNVNYDDTILSLDDVIFDTGNSMTNFANHKEQEAKVNIGSLDQLGEVAIKTGAAYKLIFTPNETLQNTSGLITFKLTEGIKADGQKVKFIIK